ncbi:MAG: hypothetical protein KBG21_04490 [Ignavibacteria bacterium]|nr:hypothetical protein [Ignavibacteria bacterium]
MKKNLLIFYFLFLFVISSFAQEKTILYWGELLQKNITADNTYYTHKSPIVKWKGVNGASDYECKTDCSGLINQLIKQAYNIDDSAFNKWMKKKKRAYAKDYYNQIKKGNGFQGFTNIKDAKPGDVIAIKFPKLMDDTGHIMLITEAAQEIEPIEPTVLGTKQWKIKIIDESGHGHGTTDTRYLGNGKYKTGLGTGYFRIYTDSTGEIVGYAWSTETGSKYREADIRKVIIGRLNKKFE